MKKLLSPPVFEDDDLNLTARLLYGILIAVVAITLFLTLPLSLILPSGNMAIAMQGFGALTLSALVFFLIRRGKVRLAGWLLLLLFWLLNTTAVWTGGGIRASAFTNFMLVVFTAGLLLGARVGFAFTILSAVFGLIVVLAENNGVLTGALVQQTSFTLWFSNVAIFAMVATLQGLSSRSTREALRRARGSEARAKHELEERKRAEEKYRNIVEQAVNGIFQSTPDGRFLRVNQAMARIYGFDSPEEMLESITDIPSQLYADSSDRAGLLRALEVEGAIQGFESLSRRKDGSLIWISLNARTVRDAGGNTLYYEGTVENIAARKEAEAERERLMDELAAKNAEMERFVYTVSHDLKSPLVTILGFLGYLEDDVRKGDLEKAERDVERIHNAGVKMQDLLKDLLELSRIGRMMNEPEAVLFEALAQEAIELTDGRLRERGVRVGVGSGLPVVYGDRQRLLELMQNLIDNAAKYMGDQPKPSIEIGAAGFEDSKPIFFVRDNGIGIAPEFHERVFGLFNKLDPNAEGTGVGLALVKRIVEFHGGRIWVESEKGKGATFYFTLPPSGQAEPAS